MAELAGVAELAGAGAFTVVHVPSPPSKPDPEDAVVEAAGHEVSDQQPGQGALRRAGRHQARPGPLLPGGRGAPAGGHGGPPGAHAAVPARGGRLVLLPEAGARQPARVAARRPSWRHPTARRRRRLVAADLAHVLWAVNLACLGFHVWPSKAADPEHADELRIDLDPTPGVTFPMVQEAAHEVRRLFEELGVVALPKTTGNRGIHVYVRLSAALDVLRGACRGGCGGAGARAPSSRPDHGARGGRRSGAAGSSSTSTRTRPTRRSSARGRCAARPGAQVSTPFGWDELDGRSSPTSSRSPPCPIASSDRGDPWASMADEPQSLEPLLALHERDRAAGLMDAPWPPVYPKMPGEPPRVAPSRAKKARP